MYFFSQSSSDLLVSTSWIGNDWHDEGSETWAIVKVSGVEPPSSSATVFSMPICDEWIGWTNYERKHILNGTVSDEIMALKSEIRMLRGAEIKSLNFVFNSSDFIWSQWFLEVIIFCDQISAHSYCLAGSELCYGLLLGCAAGFWQIHLVPYCGMCGQGSGLSWWKWKPRALLSSICFHMWCVVYLVCLFYL